MDSGTIGGGIVEAIHVSRSAGEPMESRTSVGAIAGRGLDGDRYALGTGHWSPIRRAGDEMTIIEAEAIEAIVREHGFTLGPGATRRNVTSRGVRLEELIGRRFTIGDALFAGIRRCQPCSYLEGLLDQQVLYPLVNRGGIRVEVVRGGSFSVGDRIVPLD